MTDPDLLPVCGAREYLPAALVPAAIALEKQVGEATETDVERHVRCTIQEHEDGLHTAFVMDLDGVHTGSVWTSWATGEQPAAVFVMADCDGADGEPCREFRRHPGGHSHQIHDPWTERIPTP